MDAHVEIVRQQKIAMSESGACLLSIPPIENLFHLVRKESDRLAITENKVYETYNEFAKRVKYLYIFPHANC